MLSGAITRTDCHLCGGKDAEMHHHDYSKPLDVNWLCKSCHSFIHRVLRAIIRADAAFGDYVRDPGREMSE